MPGFLETLQLPPEVVRAIAGDGRRMFSRGDWGDSDYRAVHATLMGGEMSGQQPRLRLHIVVEEENNAPRRHPRSGIASTGTAAVCLRHVSQRVRRSCRLQHLDGAVLRTVYRNDNLEAVYGQGLVAQSSERPLQRGAPVEGRYHDTQWE
jgi:hypothetical protein